MPNPTPPAAPTNPATPPEFTAELWTRLLEALALPADTDLETAVTAVEDLVTTPTAASAGLTALDPGTLAHLRRDAEQGRQLAAAAAARDRTTLVAAAVRDGRIPVGRSDHWLTVLTVDPGMHTVLAGMPPGLIPVSEIGWEGQSNEAVTEPMPWFHD